MDLAELAARLGRHKTNVSRKARQLGLTDKHRRLSSPKSRRKYETSEELRRATSERMKTWIRENGHPRGALGMKHSEEVRRQVSEANRRWWATATVEQKDTMVRKRNQTNLERYGTANPAMLGVDEPFSRSAGGRRVDLDNRYFRSAWEANYARYLNWLKDQGEIVSWEYEADTFVFHGETRGAITYKPDFKVTEKDGSVVYHEVKGWMDGPSKTRLRRMKKHYPDVKVVVIGEEEYKAIAKWKGLIPEWETGRRKRDPEGRGYTEVTLTREEGS